MVVGNAVSWSVPSAIRQAQNEIPNRRLALALAFGAGAASMNKPIEISICTQQDYFQVLEELPEFWDGRDTRNLHHPFLIHEFGNSAFVIRGGLRVIAYLFGFV